MSSDTDISATALAIALVALVIAIGQILQQYYSTAEGARRCQSSVIGPWHKETKWHFRWKELRFEILFKSPEIVIGEAESEFNTMSSLKLPSQVGMSNYYYDSLLAPDSEKQNEKATTDQLAYVDYVKGISVLLVPSPRPPNPADVRRKRDFALKFWRLRAEAARDLELSEPTIKEQKKREKHQALYPIVQIIPRTWDLMPPDVVRPHASSTLGDILIMCHRLGMTWRDAAPKRDLKKLWAPTPTADTFAFGICPSDEGLGIPEIDMGNGDKVFEYLKHWDNSEREIHVDRHQKEREQHGVWGRAIYGFTMVIGVMSPYLPTAESPIFRAPHPQPPLWYQWSSPEEWHTFSNRLADFPGKEGGKDETKYKQLRWIKSEFDAQDWHEAVNESGRWTNFNAPVPCVQCKEHGKNCIGDFARRQRFKDLHAETRKYIKEFNHMKLHENQRDLSSNFYELLKSFVCLSIHRREDADQKLKDQKPTNTYGMTWILSTLITEMGHLHWDKIDDLVADMQHKGFGKIQGQDLPVREPIIEAWAILYFRHLLFHRTAGLNTKGTLRPELRNSRIPVYIG